MASKKPGFIAEVDILKSGVERVDPLADKRDEDGYVLISRSKQGQESKNKALTKEYLEQEEKLKRLKEIAEGYGMSKKDIKETKEDIAEDERKERKKEEKKAKYLTDPYFASLVSAGVMPADMDEYVKEGGKKKKKKKKKKKDKERSEIAGFSIKEKKEPKDGEKKKKKDKEKDKDDKERSEVAERFREVEKISRKNIQEIDDTMDIINGRLDDIMNNAERMKSKDYIISNYLSAKASLISTKQKIATDIGANRAKIYDIEMKQKKNESGGASDADMIAKLFPGIVLGGKSGDLNKYMESDGKNKDGKKKKKKKKNWDDYDEDDVRNYRDDELDRREQKLLESGDIEYSSYDENIEWEGNFKVAIKKAYTTDEWKFVAIDDEGNIIKGFPKSHLPSKKQCAMKFDDEKDMAFDKNTNRAYQVFNVPTI